jgi:predicted nucleic acid-binding Zn ribbon protein
MPKATHHCRECGNAIAADRKPNAKFCSDGCKAAWNNRRKKRGADIYDLWMAMRYERDEAKRLGVWKEMCRLSEKWHEQDTAAGIVSYESPTVVLQRLKDNGKLRRGRIYPGKRH